MINPLFVASEGLLAESKSLRMAVRGFLGVLGGGVGGGGLDDWVYRIRRRRRN